MDPIGLLYKFLTFIEWKYISNINEIKWFIILINNLDYYFDSRSELGSLFYRSDNSDVLKF